MTDQQPIFRPTPRRTFELTPASTESSVPPSPSPEGTNPEQLEARLNAVSTPSKTRSVLNLTSSTLLGIYSATGYGVSREEPSTPWGTGAQTPSRRQSADIARPVPSSVSWGSSKPRASFDRRRVGLRGYYLPLFFRSILLFAFGVAYGIIITQLHDNQKLSPVNVDGINRESWHYLVFWGFGGVALGSLLPWVDMMWDETSGVQDAQQTQSRQRSTSASGNDSISVEERPASRFESRLGADWTPMVRSIGAFVGIAFAIRKLPWQSTLQVSLTLALANPVLWYLIDRSMPGFVLSATVGIAGTLALLGINPDIVPSPAMASSRATTGNASISALGIYGFITSERVGIWTWIASILFCSCVCFGNIGRRLAPGGLSRSATG